MSGYLLDTNICIYLLNARNKEASLRTTEEEAVRNRFLQAEAVFMSEVSFGELLFGAENSARRELNLARLEVFLLTVPARPVETAAWRLFGKTKAELKRLGFTVSDLDLLIACVARTEDLVLVSHDQGFRNLPADFRRETWAA